jgi:hypothetical protein
MTEGSTTIKVTVAGVDSNTLAFTTRALGTNSIYFVRLSDGDDAHDGTHDANGAGDDGPFLTPSKFRAVANAGDLCYIRAGTYTAEEAYDAMIVFYTGGSYNWNSGTSTKTIALIGYPGEVAQMGDGTNGDGKAVHFMLTSNYSNTTQTLDYWTISKLKILMYNHGLYDEPPGSSTSYWQSTGTRWIGNDMEITCGTGDGVGFGINPYGTLTNYSILANYFHDIGKTYLVTVPKYAVYIGGNSSVLTNPAACDYIYIGWNEVHNTGRSFDIYGHHTDDSFDHIYIYNNYVHESSGTCSLTFGGDPSVTQYDAIQNCYIYNNIITDSQYTSMRLTDNSYGGYGGNFFLYNNTIFNSDINGDQYDVDPWGSPTAVVMKNNLVYSGGASDNTGYVRAGAFDSGNNNLWFGKPADTPAWSTSDQTTDPTFVNAATGDFNLQAGSPAIIKGVAITTFSGPWDTSDYYGVSRGASWDIGAIKYGTAESVTATHSGCSGSGWGTGGN